MRRAITQRIKAQKALRDRIAQASGYKDYADALAHIDPRTKRIPKVLKKL